MIAMSFERAADESSLLSWAAELRRIERRACRLHRLARVGRWLAFGTALSAGIFGAPVLVEATHLDSAFGRTTEADGRSSPVRRPG
jgi:hypothetical protein